MLDFETREFLQDAITGARAFVSEHRQSLIELALAMSIPFASAAIGIAFLTDAPRVEQAGEPGDGRPMPTAAPEATWNWPITGEPEEPRRKHGRRG